MVKLRMFNVSGPCNSPSKSCVSWSALSVCVGPRNESGTKPSVALLRSRLWPVPDRQYAASWNNTKPNIGRPSK